MLIFCEPLTNAGQSTWRAWKARSVLRHFELGSTRPITIRGMQNMSGNHMSTIATSGNVAIGSAATDTFETGDAHDGFRDKSIIGDGLRARSPAGQESEAVFGCEILNRMIALGRPVSYRIGR